MKSQTPKGLIQGLLIKFSKESKMGITYSARELEILFSEKLKEMNQLESVANAHLEAWKGKSTFQLIKKPDRIIAITFQKKDQDSEPKEIRKEITRDELNNMLLSLNGFQIGDKVDTKTLASRWCKFSNIYYNSKGKSLFEKGRFNWDNVFADRSLHQKINLILRILDYEELTRYRGKKSEILSTKLNIQTVLG